MLRNVIYLQAVFVASILCRVTSGHCFATNQRRIFEAVSLLAPSAIPIERTSIAGRPATSRSAVANRTRLHCGVDGRSASARRFKDLVADFAIVLGGYEGLSEADAVLVREIAAKTIGAEALQAQLANGRSVDSEQSVRVSNVLARLLSQLERRRKALAPPAKTLADHVAARAAAKARRC